MDIIKYTIPRDEIAKLFNSPRSRRVFEQALRAVSTTETSVALAVEATTVLKDATFLTLSPNAELPNERVLEIGPGLSATLTDTTLALDVSGSVVRTTGGFAVTMTATATTSLILPTSGTLASQEWVTANFSGGGGVTDGDKGDVVVSGTGSVWTIDSGAVTFAKMANLAANSIIGNNTGSAATPVALTAAQVRTLLNVANGATANSADATLLARANHTGTQTSGTISDFNAATRAQTEAELVAGANVTITPSGSGATRQLTIAATGVGGGSLTSGVATIDFGAFPGASDASVAVTGQTGILSGSAVNAWPNAVATADHSAVEHLVDPPRFVAGDIIPGVGFTIYGFTQNTRRHYGQYSAAWAWS